MEILWKKESQQDGALYVKFLKDVCEYFPEKQYVSNKKKNNKVADQLIYLGNIELLENNYLAALNYYDKSLCFYEIGSENMNISYANRSACFLSLKLYKKCLADIEIAIAECPDRLIFDLLKRKEFCSMIKDTHHPIEDFSPQLSFEEDESFFGMASSIEITCNEEFGRHIKAKCDIDVGNIILIENSFISTNRITEWKFCNHCLKRVTNLIPCSRCTYAMYCDRTCLESDIFHETECGIIITDSGSIPQITQHIQRSIITAISIFPTIEDLMEFVEEAVRDKSKKVPSSILDNKSRYYLFLQLSLHWTLKRSSDSLQTMNHVYHYFLSFPALKEKFNTERKKRFLMHLIGYHFSIAMTNGFFDGKNSYNYIIQSYFNHSCSPNIGNYAHQKKIICIAIRPIKKGEQLFISYTSEKETVIRQEHIYESWGLQCKCEKCEPCLQSISDEEKLFPCINPDLDVILNAMKDESYKTEKTILLMMKEMLISFLRKYGRLHWNDKIDLVTKYFMEALQCESAWISND